MLSPRAAHTATLLPDGRVLVAGGCTAAGCEPGRGSATAELYDPETRAFRSAGRTSGTRIGHTATLLPDGKVLLVGGWGGDHRLMTAELYDPKGGTFRATGSMAEARSGHTATLLRDGRVLVAGGDGSVRSAEVYDPRTGRFSAAGSLSTPRSAHTASLLPDGSVLIAGGSSRRGSVLSSAEVYDPATGRFTPTGEMIRVRHKHAAVTLRNGTVLIVGGSDASDWRGRYVSAELYTPGTGRFTPAADMALARFKLGEAVALLDSGEVLVGGGGESVELYEPERSAFRTPEGRLDAVLMFPTATLLRDGSVLMAGGYDPRIQPTDGAWVYRR
ncbi:MAG TPA: kelch repeat-containing protein [Longimicrobiaceae bacterium]|nr:kelch repeat-containing protein [Longimicrobiaceae bacterium]